MNSPAPKCAAFRPSMAEALGVSADYLLSGNTEEGARASFEDREMLELFRTAQQFPEKQKEMVKELIGALSAKLKLRELAS